jgi:hypothetical protein
MGSIAIGMERIGTGMLQDEYDEMQKGLSKLLHKYNRLTNREESYNNGILATKSILKRFSLHYGFNKCFDNDEYMFLKQRFAGKFKYGGRYDDDYNGAVLKAIKVLRGVAR